MKFLLLTAALTSIVAASPQYIPGIDHPPVWGSPQKANSTFGALTCKGSAGEHAASVCGNHPYHYICFFGFNFKVQDETHCDKYCSCTSGGGFGSPGSSGTGGMGGMPGM